MSHYVYLLLVCIFVWPLMAFAGNENTIKIGMSTALSGPARALGRSMKLGVERYFRKANREGGVFGKQLKLIALDDAYEPQQTAPNVRKLIAKDKVFAIIGNVGTPTAIVSVPIANEHKTPFFGAFTGAGILRKSPPDRYVFNFRASYEQEIADMINGFVKEMNIKPSEIAFFTQNDGYGDAGYKGGIKALQELGYTGAERLPHGRYNRNTTDIESGLLKLLEASVRPKAVIMVGAYKPCAAFIKLAKEEKLKAWFANVSFVGSKALLKELGSQGENVIVTQVVPFYKDHSIPAVKEYAQEVPPGRQGFVSLEGYLAAKAFVTALKKAGKNPSQEGFIDTLESLSHFRIGLNESHSLSKQHHQISQMVWPTRIKSGKFVPFEWKDLSGTQPD